MYTRYINAPATPRYLRVSFLFGDREVFADWIKEGSIPCYGGIYLPQIKGWSTKRGGMPEDFKPVHKNTIYYALLDDGETGLTLGQIKYILDGNLPTRNWRRFLETEIDPEEVIHDPETDLFFCDIADPLLQGDEWVTVCPQEMEDAAMADYFYCSPIRREVKPGVTRIQMLSKPEHILSIALRIDEYAEIPDVEAEQTDMTKEELRELFGGTLPTFNKVIQEAHEKHDTDFDENLLELSLPDLEDEDFIDFDTADRISKQEHTDWRAAGITYHSSENQKAYLEAHGILTPGAVFHFYTRITKQKEV